MPGQKTIIRALHCGALATLLNGPFTAAAQTTVAPANTSPEFERQYKERIIQDRINGIYIPKNLDEVIVELNKNISPESQAKIKIIPEDTVCPLLHRRLGTWMIHNWGFYEGSRLSHYLRSAGVSYPDDMADFLILAFHRHLNGRPIGIKELATRYREIRKKEFDADRREGTVIQETTRARPKPAGAAPAPATTPAASKPAGAATAPATQKPAGTTTAPATTPTTQKPAGAAAAPPKKTVDKPKN